MLTPLLIASVFALGLLAGWSLYHLRTHLHRTESRLSGLEATLEKLQEAQAKHLPYRTADEIEHATAALLKLKFEQDFRAEMIENALAHLHLARSGNKTEK
jgi:hypothetical protein